jgi:membrane-associated phospholipid phosphatase
MRHQNEKRAARRWRYGPCAAAGQLDGGRRGRYRPSMPRPGRPEASPAASSAAALAPPWAAPVAIAALLVGSLLAALVWHATQLDPVDAWVLRWQDVAYTHAGGIAAIISGALTPVALVTMVAGAALAWLARRRDAVVLALAAAPATFLVEVLLKRLVHRQWPGGPALVFPSGHLAVATAAALTAVLVLRVAPVAPRTRLVVAWLAGGFVLLIAVARLVETVHSLTDLVGGGATGAVVTLGAALAITTWSRRPGPSREDRAV